MDIEIKQKNRFIRKYGILIGAGVLLLGILIWGVIESQISYQRVEEDSLITGEVKEGEFNDFIRLTGKVETGVIVQVSALETGIVEKKWVEEGAMVEPGQVILTLVNPNLQQQILDSESQLAEKQNMLRDTELAMEKERLQVRQDLLSARTALNQKRRQYQQKKTLYEENLISREEFLQAKEEYDLARESQLLLEDKLRQDSLYRQVQLSQMRESLDNMRQNFSLVRQRADNLNIRASHAGQLGALSAEIGQSIAPGQQVGQINILDNYKISVKIDEHYIDRVMSGLTGKSKRQGNNLDVEVIKVYPEVAQGQFKADLRIVGEKPANIRVGQSVPVDLELGVPGEAILLPRGPYFQSTGGKWIYVLDESGKRARRREIKIGRQNPQYYEVLEGLTAGERVIISSYKNFGDADELKITD